MTSPGRTLDAVEGELQSELEALGRHQARILVLIREADRMQAATVDGSRTMGEWLAARLDMAPEHARTLVAAARGSHDMPRLEQDLATGLVSFDRLIELVRAQQAGVDVPDHRQWDVSGLRSVIARRRRGLPATPCGAAAARYLVIQPSLDEARWRLHGLLTGSDGARVEAALHRRADQIVDGTGERPSLSQRRADALVDLCSGVGGPVSEPELVVFLDSDGPTAGGLLPVRSSVVDEVACTGSVATIDVSHPGRPLSRGRATRVISRRLRQAMLHRDGGRCVVDGCTSRYRLQPHHIVPWSEGGPTDPDNLATLCWFHHHVVVHGHGRRIDPESPPQRRRFLREPSRAPPG
ncbi:MAG: DUF222 domain-containing protein [Acidimicrobiia bacterium]